MNRLDKISEWFSDLADNHIFIAISISCIFFMIICFILIVIAGFIGNHYTRINCNRYSLLNHWITQYRYYTFWNTSCVVKVSGNHWISVNNLKGYLPVKG